MTHNSGMVKLSTLTVQDMLWINLQLTKTSKSFNFGRLEEATYYQYGYGSSVDLVGQAARLLTGFGTMRPFSSANQATALVATLAFLECNGKHLKLDPAMASSWAMEIWADPSAAEGKIAALTDDDEIHLHHGVPDKREAIFGIMET